MSTLGLIIISIIVHCHGNLLNIPTQDPPRPEFPLNTLIQGWWYCGGVSPYCISEYIVGYQGMVQAWFKFNSNDNLLDNYREDAVMNNTGWMFNREYVTRSEINEYAIATSTESNFTCYAFSGGNFINRNWLENATYIGVSSFDNNTAYEFKNFWEIKGHLVPYTGYVSVATEQILGWVSLGYTYRYNNVIALDSIDPQLFEEPAGVKCQNMSSEYDQILNKMVPKSRN